MAATAESVARPIGFRSSAMRRPLQLQGLGRRLLVDSDGAVRSLASLEEKRALFGLEQLWFYKVQAGIVVPAQKPDWEVRLTPGRARLSGRVFDFEVVQSLEFHPGQTAGFIRTVKIKNVGQGPTRLRALELLDPTAAHYPDPSTPWGSLGINAFNRESHVAMDEVSDPPSARVAGANPAPSRFYLTTSRQRAQEVIASGELPEATAGMSGQVLVISDHELDVAPGETKELTFAMIYNPGKLEDALADFGRLRAVQPPRSSGPVVACSDPAVNDAALWALSAVQGARYLGDPLDRHESLWALCTFYPSQGAEMIADARGSLRKDGSVPHSLDPSKPGLLETSLLLKGAALIPVASQDKKLAKSNYPLIKKGAGFLMSAGVEAVTDGSLPQGWRRKLGSGYPTGEIPEVALAVAAALEAASQAAKLASKPDDAGRFMERSRLIAERVRKSLLDDRGFLSLCRDSSGRLRTDETVDMAVASYRHPFMESAEQAAAHRLLEKDFDTPFGPRCVPTSNMVYFNSTYGDGQLGGVWTRASLAHVLLCYRAGLGGVGSLSMGKVAKLVVEEGLKLGGAPGEFPHWVDPERKEAHGSGSDPVAAARFLEAVLKGELGLPEGPERPTISPPQTSTLSWVMATDFWAGEPASVFVGREGRTAHVFYSGSRIESGSGVRFSKCERIELPQRGVQAVTFYNPGQIVCVGNTTGAPVRLTLTFPPRAQEFTKLLSTPLEEFDPGKGSWSKTASLRVSPTMGFELSVGPNGWKAYRVSTP